MYEVKNLKGIKFFIKTHPQFLAKLFSGSSRDLWKTIEIRSVARDPGSRAKICVHSKRLLDRSCRGLRWNMVVGFDYCKQLHCEKIDIISGRRSLTLAESLSQNPKGFNWSKNKKIDIILSEENPVKPLEDEGKL